MPASTRTAVLTFNAANGNLISVERRRRRRRQPHRHPDRDQRRAEPERHRRPVLRHWRRRRRRDDDLHRHPGRDQRRARTGSPTRRPANYNGPATLTITTNDDGNTGTDPGLTGDADDEQDSDQIAITVNSVNDEPAGADKTVTASEDDPYVFLTADFGFTDPIDGDDFAGVVLTTLPVEGDLRLNGVNITVAGTFITAADIAAGLLTFLADPDEFGDNYASFTFQVRDDGGILNGGVDTDQSPNTMTIDVEADNFPPVLDLNGAAAGDGSTASVTEQSGPATLAPDLTITDADDTDLEGATVTITGNLQASRPALGRRRAQRHLRHDQLDLHRGDRRPRLHRHGQPRRLSGAASPGRRSRPTATIRAPAAPSPGRSTTATSTATRRPPR